MSAPLEVTTSEHGGLKVCTLGPPAGEPVDGAAVLCHGFGAPGDDLVPLGKEVFQQRPDLAGRVRLHFPEGALDLSTMGMPGARAWWMLDFKHLSLPPAERSARLRAERPPNVIELRKQIDAFTDSLLAADGLTKKNLVVGGFSQGAMIMTDYALRHDDDLGGLAAMSGAFAAESDWREWAVIGPKRKAFLSHGRQDGVLPFAGAEALRDFLTESGHEVRFEAFDGPHTIPAVALEGLGDLLEHACDA